MKSGPQLDQLSPLAPRTETGRGLPVPWLSPFAVAQFANLHTSPRCSASCSGVEGTSDDPFQELPNQACNWSASLLQWLGIPNVLLEDVPDVPPECYSCQFKVSKLSR